MVAVKMDDLQKQIEQLKQERDALWAVNETMKGEAAAHVEKEKELKQQMVTMQSELVDQHAEVKAAIEKLNEANNKCSCLQSEMEGREAAQELQYYRTIGKECRRWEEREERLLSRLEATPAPDSDRKLDLSVREKEALTKELSEVKDQLESVLLAKESLSQQLEAAEQGKVEAEQQLEEQQLRIEELQAELHLDEVRAKRVERDTLTNPGREWTVDRAGADKSPPASPISGDSVGGTTDKPPPAKEKHTEPPGDKTAATVEMTASPTKPPPADTGTPVKERKNQMKRKRVMSHPIKRPQLRLPQPKLALNPRQCLPLLE